MEFWAYSDHYPIFLDPNMRNLLRVNLYRGINFLNNPMSRCNSFMFSGCTNQVDWIDENMPQNFQAVLNYQKHKYTSTKYDFLTFSRNSVMHLKVNVSIFIYILIIYI